MPAPEKVLGQAVRALDVAPSKDWLKGFDDGYDAAVTVISDLMELTKSSKDRCKIIRKQLDDVSREVNWLSDDIGHFTHPVKYQSIVSKELE